MNGIVKHELWKYSYDILKINISLLEIHCKLYDVCEDCPLHSDDNLKCILDDFGENVIKLGKEIKPKDE